VARRDATAARLPKHVQARLDEDVATRYALDVVRGKVPAGRLHVASCRRHLEDLRRKGSEWTWNLDAVLRFQRFCSLLPIPDKPDLRFELQPWQVFVAGSLLGWQDANGLRRFRRVYVEVARKNAKTMLLSVLTLYLAFFAGEIRAEVYCCATTLDQAKLVYNYARDIVDQSPHLRGKAGDGTIVCFGGIGPRAKPRLYDPLTGSILEPVAADSTKRDGYNPSAFVADELHEHPDSRLVDKLRTGQGARREPLQIAITTAGADQGSYCYQVRGRGAKVLDHQVEDERAFFFICHRDEKDAWWSKRAVVKANPNLGVSVQYSFIEDEIQRARTEPREENTVRRMYLSDWVTQETRWIPLARWDQAPPLPKPAILRSRPCFGGLALSRSRDMAALELLFPPEGKETVWSLLSWFWVPEKAAKEREKKNLQNYTAWAKQGLLHLTTAFDGEAMDFAAVKAKVADLANDYDIRSIGFEKHGALQLAQEIEQEQGVEMVAMRITNEHLCEPSGKFEDLWKTKKLAHGGNPMLRWMAENAETITDGAGNWRVTRGKNPEKRVEGILAAIFALHCATLTDEAQSAESAEGLVTMLKGWA